MGTRKSCSSILWEEGEDEEVEREEEEEKDDDIFEEAITAKG